MNAIPKTFRVRLTRREKEVLTCIAEGMSTKEIAGKLDISEHTVSNHRKNMFRKRGSSSYAEPVNFSRNYSFR